MWIGWRCWFIWSGQSPQPVNYGSLSTLGKFALVPRRSSIHPGLQGWSPPGGGFAVILRPRTCHLVGQLERRIDQARGSQMEHNAIIPLSAMASTACLHLCALHPSPWSRLVRRNAHHGPRRAGSTGGKDEDGYENDDGAWSYLSVQKDLVESATARPPSPGEPPRPRIWDGDPLSGGRADSSCDRHSWETNPKV